MTEPEIPSGRIATGGYAPIAAAAFTTGTTRGETLDELIDRKIAAALEQHAREIRATP